VDLTHAVAEKILLRYDASLRLKRVGPLEGSATKRAFELTLEEDRRLVLKLFDPAQAWQLQQEVLVYELLARTPVPVPSVLFADDSRELIDSDYVLLNKVGGAIVASLGPLPPEDAHAIYRLIGETLRHMHTVTFDQFGFFDRRGPVDPIERNRDFVSIWIGRGLERFGAAGGSPRLKAAIEQRVRNAVGALDGCEGPVLCHGDLHESNILVSEAPEGWKVEGVVDVGGAIAADPLFDLARTDYWSTRGDPTKRAGLFDGYGDLRRDWEEAIAVYSLHHALELWHWFHRAGIAEMCATILSDLERLANG